ncbi:MAG: serine/threonine-protein kinase [Planctomycetota bacterium]
MPTPHETAFAAAVVKLGLLDQTAVDKAAKVAETIREHDKYADVRTVLVGRQKLTDEDADRVLKAMGEVVMFCSVCGKKYAANPYDPTVPCPSDDSPLKVVLAPKAATPIKPSTCKNVRGESVKPPKAAPGSKAANDTLIGRRLGNFMLREVIAADSMSRTYKAALSKSDMVFAVKVLTSDDKLLRKRFSREGRYAALIHHPNVVRILDTGETDAVAWIAMEFIDGVPLDRVLQASDEHRLSPAEAVKVAVAVLEGLDAAHQIGIVHRNIKPGNLIVTDDGARIINFSSARMQDESKQSEQLTAPGASLGTPHYMAPEQIQSSKVDFRADLYAVGSTLFHMLTGQPPYTGSVITEIVKAKLRTDPPRASSINKTVSRALDEVVDTLLSREPAGRYASAGHAVIALESVRV